MLKNIGEKVKNEVNESLGKVSGKRKQVQIKIESWLLNRLTKQCVEITILYKAPEANAARSEDMNKQDDQK